MVKAINAGISLLGAVPLVAAASESMRRMVKTPEELSSGVDEFIKSSTVAEIPEKTLAQSAKEAEDKKKIIQERFHAYLKFKQLEFPITKQEMEDLLKYDGDEFMTKGVEFVAAKYKIPKSLIPSIGSVPMHKETFMAYDFIKHIIYTNPNYQMTSKEELFGNIVHELRHTMQNFDILRTEGIGEKAVIAYAKKLAKNQVASINKLVETHTIEQIKMLTQDENAIKDFEILKKLKQNPKEYELNNVKLFKMYEQQYTQQLEAFRQQVISEMGELKADSAQGLRAKKYLKSFLTNYYKKDGTVHAGKYNTAITEREALDLGYAYDYKLKNKENERFCFMQFARDYKVKTIESEERKNEMKQEIKEIDDIIQEMGGWKAFLKYVYE